MELNNFRIIRSLALHNKIYIIATSIYNNTTKRIYFVLEKRRGEASERERETTEREMAVFAG